MRRERARTHLLIVTPLYAAAAARTNTVTYLWNSPRSAICRGWSTPYRKGRGGRHPRHALKELKAKSSKFAGMKHAVNDLDFVSECLAAFGEDFKVLQSDLKELSFPDDGGRRLRADERGGNLCPGVLSRDVRSGSGTRFGGGDVPPEVIRDQSGCLFRYEPDPAQVHDETARPSCGERASPAHGAGTPGAREAARLRD